MEKLNVSCSPGTFGRVVSDLKYRKELSDQMLAEHQNYNGIVFSQTVEEQPKYYEDTATDIVETASAAQYAETIFTPLGNINDGKQYWCEGAVKFMLTSIEELLPKVGKSIAVKIRAKMYTIVSERMAGENYPFSPMQIEYKFRALERQYKKTVLNNRQTGRSRHICQYEKELADILGRKKGINPDCLLNAADVVAKSQAESMEESLSSDFDQSLSDNTPSCSSQAPKRRKTAPADAILLEISKIREEKEDFHTKLLEMLKKKDDAKTKEKEERANKKEKREKEKEKRAKEKEERAKEKLVKEKEKMEKAKKREEREEIKLKLLQKLLEKKNIM